MPPPYEQRWLDTALLSWKHVGATCTHERQAHKIASFPLNMIEQIMQLSDVERRIVVDCWPNRVAARVEVFLSVEEPEVRHRSLFPFRTPADRRLPPHTVEENATPFAGHLAGDGVVDRSWR